jgi:hypothetical protein
MRPALPCMGSRLWQNAPCQDSDESQVRRLVTQHRLTPKLGRPKCCQLIVMPRILGVQTADVVNQPHDDTEITVLKGGRGRSNAHARAPLAAKPGCSHREGLEWVLEASTLLARDYDNRNAPSVEQWMTSISRWERVCPPSSTYAQLAPRAGGPHARPLAVVVEEL